MPKVTEALSEKWQPPGHGGFLSRLSEWQMSVAVVLLGLFLYVPFAGTYGLWDPWETHYGEVARQMTERGDFISLWWPGSPRDRAEFWSKPVLTFWVLSLGMHMGGVAKHGSPDSEMAVGNAVEWSMRIPIAFMASLALWAVYLVVSRFAGRRAGFLSSLVLATCPMFLLVARQAMTDMIFVGPMAMALALGTLALLDDRDDVLPRRGKGKWSWPHDRVFYTTVGVFALLVLTQLIVFSIQLRVKIPWGDKKILMYGIVAMIPYFLAAFVFLFFAARARYRAPLYLYMAAMMCGLAILAKGLAGLGLPVIVFLAFLGFTWNWKRLGRAQLIAAVAVSVLAVALVAVPWHHSMIIRHGWAFWDELFGDNHWRRMMLGRHGDRGSFEYFLREMGYAVLPWLAVAPAALATMVLKRFKESRRQALYWLGAIWCVAAYSVVSFSMTKFHHYILPAIPGLAIVIGCFLDDQLKARHSRTTLLAVLVGLPLVGLVLHDLTKAKHSAQLFLWLFNYDYVHSKNGRPWPQELDFRPYLYVFGALFAVGSAMLSLKKIRTWGVWVMSVSAVCFTYFLLDVYMRDVTPFWSQKYAIETYYKTRQSADEKLAAYKLYWRGETFYTKNDIWEGPMEERTVFDLEGADQKLKEYIEDHRGTRLFFLYERTRKNHLIRQLPSESRGSFTVLYDKNNKFSLARVDL